MPMTPVRHRPEALRSTSARWLCAALLSAAAACTPRTDADPSTVAAKPAPSSAVPKAAVPPSRPDARTAGVVDRFAHAMATSGLSWAAVDREGGLTDLKELEDKPVGIDHAKSGRAVLPGYGAAKLPRGAGADYTEVDGNEGDAQVVLYGGPTSVRWLTVSKYYEERDVRGFVANVLPSFRIMDEAPACAGAPTDTVPRLFHVTDGDRNANTLTAVVNIDDSVKYGPPVTMLSLYTHEPTPFEIGCPIVDDQGEK